MPVPVLLRKVTNLLADTVKNVSDVVWPRVCPVCESDARRWLCDACLGELIDASTQPSCQACGRPASGSACPWCGGRGDGPIKRVVRLGVYEPPLSSLIVSAKFSGRWELCRPLGHALADVAGDLPPDAVVVPVPLHAHRLASRGFDQAYLIAEALAGQRRVPLVRALKRQRHTRPQTALTGTTARQQNLRDAFALNDLGGVEGRAVVLVDDVMTSGSTLRSAARAVQAGKPRLIMAAVLAVATRAQEARPVKW